TPTRRAATRRSTTPPVRCAAKRSGGATRTTPACGRVPSGGAPRPDRPARASPASPRVRPRADACEAPPLTQFRDRYRPWAVVAGASVGIGADFCRQIAAEGVNVVLVSRSVDKLEALATEIGEAHGVETRVAGIDLAAPGAEADLFAATDGLEIGLFVYN